MRLLPRAVRTKLNNVCFWKSKMLNVNVNHWFCGFPDPTLHQKVKTLNLDCYPPQMACCLLSHPLNVFFPPLPKFDSSCWEVMKQSVLRFIKWSWDPLAPSEVSPHLIEKSKLLPLQSESLQINARLLSRKMHQGYWGSVCCSFFFLSLWASILPASPQRPQLVNSIT